MVTKHAKKGSNTADILMKDLIEQNIGLQHKMMDLMISVKDLTQSVKGMVELFADAGEHIKKGKYEDPLLVKLDDLLEQNKNIARGLLMLEKFVREKQTAQTAFAPRGFQRQQEGEY
jgi:hypothetical protein